MILGAVAVSTKRTKRDQNSSNPTSLISPLLSAFRTSGPAPFATTYDASGTTVVGMAADEVIRRCHFLFEVQQAGSTLAGTYSTTGLPRYSQGGGPQAGFIMYAPGAYTVKLTVTKGLPWAAPATGERAYNYIVGDLVTYLGNTYSCSTAHACSGSIVPGAHGNWTLLHAGIDQSIASTSATAQDADSAWPGTATICINNAGTSDGLGPAGCAYASSVGTVISGRRYLFKNAQTHSANISVPMGVSNVMFGAYGSGAQAIIGSIISAENGSRVDYPTEIIIDNLRLSAIDSNTSASRWTVCRNTLRNPSPGQGAMIGNGGAMEFYSNVHSNRAGMTWPLEWCVFENDVDGGCTTFTVSGTPDPNYPTLGIAAYFMKGSCVANISNHVLEHSLRIWGSYKAAISHNDARGFASQDHIRSCIKSMAAGGNFTWSDTLVGAWTYLNNQATQHTTYADNVFGRNGEHTGNFMTGPSPQNAGDGTCEITINMIWERNLYTRANAAFAYGAWAEDLHPVAKNLTTRGNLSFQDGTPVNFACTPVTSATFPNQSADAAATYQRANGCGPYFGQFSA